MFKPGDKVKRIGGTDDPNLGMVLGRIYTVKSEENSMLRFNETTPNSVWHRDFFVLAPKTIPHVHAELIKAWADGAKIEFKATSGIWTDTEPPIWSPTNDYRIKPEPKPDIIKYARIDVITGHQYWIKLNRQSDSNMKYTFDGETGKLKSVELIK